MAGLLGRQPGLCDYYERAGYEPRGLLVVNQWRARLFEKRVCVTSDQ